MGIVLPPDPIQCGAAAEIDYFYAWGPMPEYWGHPEDVPMDFTRDTFPKCFVVPMAEECPFPYARYILAPEQTWYDDNYPNMHCTAHWLFQQMVTVPNCEYSSQYLYQLLSPPPKSKIFGENGTMPSGQKTAHLRSKDRDWHISYKLNPHM